MREDKKRAKNTHRTTMIRTLSSHDFRMPFFVPEKRGAKSPRRWYRVFFYNVCMRSALECIDGISAEMYIKARNSRPENAAPGDG